MRARRVGHTSLAVAALLLVLPTVALAGLYKCRDADGNLTYSDRACVQGATEETMDLPHGEHTDPDQAGRSSSGSGFVVSREGHILTNYHVAGTCAEIRIRQDGQAYPAELVMGRSHHDLALLRAQGLEVAPATLSSRGEGELGEPVIAVGYPLHGLVSDQLNVTNGIVSALAGLHNDPTTMQITVPLQPGNSGGPVMGSDGLVKGIAMGKLSERFTLEATGMLPENVNFAIKGWVALALLDAAEVDYAHASALPPLPTQEIARRAREFTVLVECVGAPAPRPAGGSLRTPGDTPRQQRRRPASPRVRVYRTRPARVRSR